MNILTNKHMIVAMIVAPILALISYFSVDALVSEEAHAAKAGSHYSLVEKPNCRYNSGLCQLKNGEFELNLSSVEPINVQASALIDDLLEVEVYSKHPLDNIMVAQFKDKNDDVAPTALTPLNQERTHWMLRLNRASIEQSRIRLVAMTNGSQYFGEAGLKFLNYKTSYQQDFRQIN